MADPPFPDPDSRHVLEPDCARCPALAEARECISWGNGSLTADVMVVGEAPGAGNPEAERWRGGNWTGMAYTARHSGRIVRSILADLGYGPDDVFVTNAVKCFPADGEGGNREPTAGELERCFDHLRAEIDAVEPAVVLATGRHATSVLLEREGIELAGFVDSILEPIECPALGTIVVPLLHPAYQHVWLSRLDFDREEYVDAIGEAIDVHVDTLGG